MERGGTGALTVSEARFETASAEETQALGRRLGALAETGDLYLLRGPLGAGKTTLTQGIAWGAGASGYAHSPTFVLVHEYQGRVPVYHVDLFRVDGGDLEAGDLGFGEMLEAGACVVEWPEKAEGIFPQEHLAVTIAFGDAPDARAITLEAHGERYARIAAALRDGREFSV